MLENIPTNAQLQALMGAPLYELWCEMCRMIEAQYEMDRLWNKGWRDWKYEYKYRRGGKTLCTLYAKENGFMVMLTFGKAERDKIEALRGEFAPEFLEIYDAGEVLHDGKWLSIEPQTTAMLEQIMKTLPAKRRPNRK